MLTLMVTALTMFAADPEWGVAKDGVATQLTLVSKEPKIGSAITLKLEAKNSADMAHGYDDQQAAVNNSLSVKGRDGKPVSYIATSFQTSGHRKALTKGQTVTVFGDLDLAQQYLIDKPGKYVVQFVGRGGLPASNELSITVSDAPLPDRLKLLAALHKSAPKGWRVTQYDTAITLLNTPTRLKADATSVTLFFTETKEPKQKGEYVAETKLGHAWIQAESPVAAARWPDYAKFIREQLKAVEK